MEILYDMLDVPCHQKLMNQGGTVKEKEQQQNI